MRGKLIAFAVAVLSVATIGVTQLPANAAVDSTRDCDQYAVVYCGTMSPQEARNKYTQKDHAKIFQSMGISLSDLNGTFKEGVVYQDGRVVVAGKTVATGAVMAARGLGGSQIAGTGAQKVSVRAMGSAQTAMVKFDQNGRFVFAIMKPCGNPVTATPPPVEEPPKPSAQCKILSQQKLSDTRRRYEAVATLKNGAKVRSYTFIATKDGKQVDKKTISTAKTTANYVFTADGPGDYKIAVSINTTEGNRSGAQCTKSFTVADVDQPGVAIEKYVGENEQKYLRVGIDVAFSYQIRVINTGDVDLKNVIVTDTPDKGVTLLSVSPSVGTIAGNTWTHSIKNLAVGQTKTFTLSAKVPEYLAGKLTNTVCVDAPEVPGNPDDCDTADVDVPPTSGNIEVCELATFNIITIEESMFDSTKHSKDLSDCTTPEELPETGPAETVLQLVGAMSLIGSSAYYIASRRFI